ncbi:MAG: hypothetical protein B7C24_08920 [Bacteroidetes bacterium 4572_77]|nr:MAG: hypothetical protein B7C24_08920 [Bacteroidetes bacterium 4572_77]
MNKELLKSLEQKSTEDLFFLFKHDGAINFEKKIMAGIILKEKGYDKVLLSQEKKAIIETITNRLKISENKDYLEKKNKKKAKRKIFIGLGYLSFFTIIGMKDYLLNEENLDWIYLSIMIIIGLFFITYQTIIYNKTVNNLIDADNENNELLRFRLKLIEKEWRF